MNTPSTTAERIAQARYWVERAAEWAAVHPQDTRGAILIAQQMLRGALAAIEERAV